MTETQTKPGSSKFFTRGWIMIAIAFVVAIVTQGFGLYSYGMIKVNLTEALGAPAAAVGGGFSCYTIAIALASLVVGDVIERFGLRVSLFISAVLYAGGFVIVSMITDLWMVYLAYIVMGVGSAFGGVVVVTSIASNWFIKRQGVATAVIWCGMLPGSLISTFIVANVGEAAGWQTAVLVLGAISFIVLVGAAFLLKWRPQDVGLLPDGMTEEQLAALQGQESKKKTQVIGLTRGQALATLSFWLIFIAYGINGFSEMGFFQNISQYLVFEGLDMTSVAAFLTFISFAGVVGRLATGVVVDKIGPKFAYLIINCIGLVGLLIFMFASTNPTMLYVAGFLFGVTLNSGIICFSTAVARTFGTKHYGQIWGATFMIKGFGDAVGVPLMAGVATTVGLGWPVVFIIVMSGIALSAVLMLLVRKEKKMTELEASQAKDDGSSTEVTTAASANA